MQGFLQSAKARATELVADVEVAAKGLVATVEAAIDAPSERSEAVVVAIAHGGPTGLQFTAPSDAPGEPVTLDSINPSSPVTVTYPQVQKGSRLVAVNNVPIEQLPLSAVVQMLQHKEDTHQDFTLTLIQPAASLLRLPDTDALLDSASVALVTARTSASVALEKTRSSLGALDGLGFSGTRGGSGGDSEPVPQAGAIAAGATESGAWAQVSLDGPSRLGSLSDGSDTTGLMRGPPPIAAASTSSVPVDYSAYYSSSATSMVQQTAATAAAPAPSPPVDYSAYYSSSATSMVQQTGVAVAASDAEPSTFSTESLDGAHDADISAGLDSMFSSRYGGGVGDEVDDVPISRGFMKSGYDVGEQITILSRRNLWRQCYVKQKRPGQLLVCCCAEDGPGLGVDDEREEWISQASKRIRDYWDGTYLQEPSALAIGSGTAHGAVAGTLSQRGDPHAVVSAPSTPQQDDLLGIFVTAPVAAPAPSGLGL